jgi:Flp pilus assembly protein TadG
MNRTRQTGVTTVEFAIIGLLALIVMFAVLEFGRLVFTVNALSEATRRGARMATVCPLNDPAIAQVTVFNAPGGDSTSPIVSGLTAGHVAVDYLDQAGNPTATFLDIQYVRVRIQNYQHRLLIPLVPLFDSMLNLPQYPSTLPRESLGVPRVGVGPLPC